MHRIAINGFGRIGRTALRAALLNKAFLERFEVVAVNDLTDAQTLAHLFKYDSVHGKYKGSVAAEGGALVIDGRRIKILSERDPAKLPWRDLGIELVVESTGVFTRRSDAIKHIEAGAKKVLITAPAEGPDITLVPGVNMKAYDPERHHIISMASCTTNALAPIVRVLHDAFGVRRGFLTTCHAYTNDQRILDLPHRDLRRARACALSIIPTTTGAARAIGDVVPEVGGRMDGWALRVPVPDVSINDIVLELEKEVTREEINEAMKAAAEGAYKGLIEYCTEPIVSCDLIGNSASAIFDASLTMVIGGRSNLVKVFAWYDNEWGYSCRLIDLICALL